MTPATDQKLQEQASNGFHFLVLSLYFLSGLASLAYEILWVRMLSLEFGVSIFGVVVTVAVFMLGLGLGSLLGLRFVNTIKNPLLYFALLEVAIALFSISIPAVFQWLLQFMQGSAGTSLYAWYTLQFCITGVILLVPALFMGIGFPVILNVCKKLKTSLELIYATNTMGAALGALLPLFLLPVLGWEDSLYTVASISTLIACIAAYLSLHSKSDEEIKTKETVPPVSRESLPVILAYAGIGASALMLEIGWTRLFGMLFLRTEYVLAIILAVFLLGTALGSYLSGHLARRNWLSLLPVFASGCVVTGLWALPTITSMINTQEMSSLWKVLMTQAAVVVMLTLPVTIILGAWLPLLNRHLGYSGIGGARLYGVNSVGAALGTIIAGFIFIPMLGTYAVIVLAALSLVIFSMAWVDRKKSVAYSIVLLLLSIPVFEMVPVSQLLPHRHGNAQNLYFNEDALNITHVIEQEDGQRILLADLQRMDASSDPASVHSQRNQGRLPLLLHPDPKSVLFLGMGTGISMSASLGYSDLQRTAVELSRGAIEATNEWFTAVNKSAGSSVHVIRDDARRYLKTGTESYDVIIGDLFHPDLVGRSALLSRQQFLRAKNHLNPDGVFVQWIALNQFDKQSLQIVLRTFKRVFPDAVLFLDAFRLALVGLNGQLSDLTTLEKKLSQLDRENRYLASGNESIHSWLGRYWGKINVDDNGDIQDEWSPKIEFRLPQARYSGEMDLAVLLHELLQHRPHVSVAMQELGIDVDNRTRFERAYIGTELAHRSWLALLQRKNSEGHRLLKLAYQANPDDRWVAAAVADATLENYDLVKPGDVSEEKILQSLLQIQPDHANALKRLWQIYLKSGDQGKALEYKERFKKLSPYDSSLKNH